MPPNKTKATKPRPPDPLVLYLNSSQFHAADRAGFIVRDPDGTLWFEGWKPYSRVIVIERSFALDTETKVQAIGREIAKVLDEHGVKPPLNFQEWTRIHDAIRSIIEEKRP